MLCPSHLTVLALEYLCHRAPEPWHNSSGNYIPNCVLVHAVIFFFVLFFADHRISTSPLQFILAAATDHLSFHYQQNAAFWLWSIITKPSTIMLHSDYKDKTKHSHIRAPWLFQNQLQTL